MRPATVPSGILASIKQRDAEIIYAGFVCIVSLRRLEISHGEESYWTFDVDREHKNVIEPDEVLPADQGWCLY